MHNEVFVHYKKKSLNIVPEQIAVYTKKGLITQKGCGKNSDCLILQKVVYILTTGILMINILILNFK
jgi:hypothetical protein